MGIWFTGVSGRGIICICGMLLELIGSCLGVVNVKFSWEAYLHYVITITYGYSEEYLEETTSV